MLSQHSTRKQAAWYNSSCSCSTAFLHPLEGQRGIRYTTVELMDPSLACFGALPPGPVPVYSRGSSLTKTSSGPSLNVESPVSAAKVAAAHNAQMGE